MRQTFRLIAPQVCEVLRKIAHYLKLHGLRFSTAVPLVVQYLDS